MPIVILGRFAGTLFLLKFFDLCGWNSGIRTIEVFFMGFAGLIRGAIAFGLCLRLDDGLPNRDVIVTTALTIVVFTTIFFGCLVGLVSVCTKEDVPEEQANVHDDEFFRAKEGETAINNEVKVDNVSENKSEHGQFQHPN